MNYEVTIGLEVHAQILTDSKMFCGCSARYWDAEPNTHVCPVCLGLPGALPVANRRAIERAALTGLALNGYFQKLRQILIWIGVNTGNMEAGALRCDANVSMRPRGQQKYGAKVEIKNMNSFRAVERALAYEIERQIQALEAGQTILQTTRGWDDAHGITVEQRSNEFAEDYRYFPDPDIPPLQIAPKWVEELRAELPELPDARRARFMTEYELSAYDAHTLTFDRGVADYDERAVAAGRTLGVAPKEIANRCTSELFRLLNETAEDLASVEVRFRPEYIAEVHDLLAKGTITRTTAKEVFDACFRSGEPPAQIVAERGLAVIGAGDALAALAREVVAANPKAVAEYKGGKATKGQANPQSAQAALESELATSAE